eukprot:GHVS01103330.1.p1 GENE.GHVS01103330.1~~GHVS01103330.1.p1  ORF type:complete len:184 (+),score=26.52 GHVS01103330.1:161-712(+)
MSLVGRFRLTLNAAQAKPSPAIGQALGPLGINMMAFCKEFNGRTAKLRPDVPVQVLLLAFTDRSFKFSLRTPSAFWFIRRAARLPTCAARPGHEEVGNVRLKEIYHIAKAKCMDPSLIGSSLSRISSHLIGTARNMGVRVSRELGEEYSKRDFQPVSQLDQMRAHQRQLNKAAKRSQGISGKK